ncbi:unnamed protein product [Trichogramma brassicae]|uniref:Uncharacterized protein n=1 Tax=Trichogramma brassicae TaxID=86971 RepID=A0A6H5JAK1_9HYME|nr:unnamed protein product [Trichogramma brassicae]
MPNLSDRVAQRDIRCTRLQRIVYCTHARTLYGDFTTGNSLVSRVAVLVTPACVCGVLNSALLRHVHVHVPVIVVAFENSTLPSAESLKRDDVQFQLQFRESRNFIAARAAFDTSANLLSGACAYKDRYHFLDVLYPILVEHAWEGRFPDLREIFRPEEIECLLADSISYWAGQEHSVRRQRFIEFVTRTGYRDEPEVDEDGKPVLRRTTALLRAAKKQYHNCVRMLFKIYDRFDVNYVDKSGLTHFHAACMSDCLEIVEKFLELGQDANCITQRTTDSPLHLAVFYGRKKVVELLLSHGADPNSTDSVGNTPLHVICKKKYFDDDLVEVFFKISDEKHRPVRVDARDRMGRTPLLSALIWCHEKLVELLLRRDADPHLIDAKGLSAMHFICMGNFRAQHDLERGVKCATLLFEIGKEKHRPSMQINVRDRSGNTPLHYALTNSDRRMIELLLRNGADTSVANKEGSTPLHMIMCTNFHNGHELVEMLFKISEENHQTVRVNARDIKGNTPLHLALQSRNLDIVKTSELLLRNGADFNLANAEGLTALHFMCKDCKIGHDVVDMLFQISEENHQTVRVNATDKLGNTPLYYAVAPIHSDCGIYWLRPIVQTLLKNDANPNLANNNGIAPLHNACQGNHSVEFLKMLFELGNDAYKPLQVNSQDDSGRTPLRYALSNLKLDQFSTIKKVAELLLRSGVDPNLADNDGSTALHMIFDRCEKRYCDDGLVKMFFETCDERRVPVPLDVPNKLGWTPLQRAVANVRLDVVDLLLNRGADLSSFVFPDANYFAKRIDSLWFLPRDVSKIVLSSSVLIVERLEKEGYVLDLCDAVAVMNIFRNYGLFQKSSDLEKRWYDDEEFASKAKEVMWNSSLSLYDLTRLKPTEASKKLNYTDLLKFVHSQKMYDVPSSFQTACIVHLCEIASRRFFREWALECFMALTRYRLPILCSSNFKNFFCKIAHILDLRATKSRIHARCVSATASASTRIYLRCCAAHVIAGWAEGLKVREPYISPPESTARATTTTTTMLQQCLTRPLLTTCGLQECSSAFLKRFTFAIIARMPMAHESSDADTVRKALHCDDKSSTGGGAAARPSTAMRSERIAIYTRRSRSAYLPCCAIFDLLRLLFSENNGAHNGALTLFYATRASTGSRRPINRSPLTGTPLLLLYHRDIALLYRAHVYI